jgi:protein RPN4
MSEEFPAALVSMESSGSEFAPGSPELKKPAGASADTGTYTCTYHGCTLRFDTPAKLQRHKREGHRNSTTMGSGADEGGMTSAAARNSQAGPHKCERINPSTGKPCNTIFSRPYDLTRHEDTIHNARKQKVHCPLCAEEKTFSRNDALTRHLRVVHPEHVELNKRRRGHD